MFHLDDEVRSWCRAVHKSGPDREARADELADHLFCEIEFWIGEGLDEEHAFLASIRRLGEVEGLEREHIKNRGMWEWGGSVLWALMTCNTRRLRQELTPMQASMSIILVSLLFAGLMIVASLFNLGAEHSQTVTLMIMAVWFVPYSLLISAGANRGSGCGTKGNKRGIA